MVLNECHSLIKYSLVFVNLIFWALGLTAVVLAVWMLVDQTFLVSLAQQQHNYNAGLYIILAAGSLLMIVSFLGCCGAFRESQCMLVGFFSCLLVVLVAQIAAGAWLYSNGDSLESVLQESVMYTVKNEYGRIQARTDAVKSIQANLGCCGAKGPVDWAESKYFRDGVSEPPGFTVTMNSDNTYKVPETCCATEDEVACNSARVVKLGDAPSADIYQEGCIDKLITVLKSQTCIILGVNIGVGLLELVGLIFSLILCCAIGSSGRYKA